MRVITYLKYIINNFIRRGYWFNNILFPDCNKFWSYNTFNTAVINLGSTSAVNAFCYDDLNIKAANFALNHHPLSGDLAILRNYYSYLKPKGSVVIISLCPFSSLSGNYQCSEDRYYTLLYPTTMPYFSLRREQQVKAMKTAPLYSYTFMGFFQDLKSLVFKPKFKQLTEKQMVADAERWLKGWKKEFSLKDFNTPLALYNHDAIEDAANILNEIISFCKEREIRPFLLIPPVYHTLGEQLTPKIREIIINSLIERVEDKTVCFHNYMDDAEFTNNETLFRNSYLMSKKGAKLFTRRVLNDLGIK